MDLTFGAGLGRSCDKAELIAAARAAEEAGFSVLSVADHLGGTSPFAVLGLAAAVTSSIRLRTYVLDAYFWNPALLAREAATLDALSGGRFELGLGAGHMKHEHLDAGLPFPPISSRVDFMSSLLADVRARLASPSYTPAPVQQPVPVVLGVWGSAGLAVAARSAEVVALTGMTQVKGARAGTFGIASSADTDRKLAELAALLSDPAPPRASVPPDDSGDSLPGDSSLPRDSGDSLPRASVLPGASSLPRGSGGSPPRDSSLPPDSVLPRDSSPPRGSGGSPSRDAGDSPVLDALLQRVEVSGSPADNVAALLAEWGETDTSVEEILDSPFFLFAPSPAAAAEELLRRRERWGITSWSTHAASVPALASVIREFPGH